MKGGCNKGKEPVIDVDDPSPKSKRTRFSTRVYDPDLFRSYATLLTHSFRNQVHISSDSTGPNLEEARGTLRLAIP